MRNLLGIEGLSREQIERLLDRAESLSQLAERENKKLPTLSGRTIVNLFFENSTRTRSSFDLAAKRLSADTVTIQASGSSVEKGESLRDTVQTLSAYEPSAIVVRSPHVGAPGMITRWTDAAVINAGDGKHEHPTQALLDAFTLRRRLGELDGRRVWIIGDVLHSRVARSNIIALSTLGAEVTVCGPPTLIPREIETLGCKVSYTLDGSNAADVLYVLRMQNERMSEDQSFIPSVREYARYFQINGKRLGAGQLLMHPGPVNRGVELSPDVVDAPQSLITEQVAAGVAVRMAVFYELLAGRAPDGGAAREPEGQIAEARAIGPEGVVR
ncbi:MAG: aspartate carbamoyltransferase catalytic subunit [Solirubrobacterales bacterium]